MKVKSALRGSADVSAGTETAPIWFWPISVSVSVPALKSALPRSADFSFIADGRDKWGLGFLITTDQVSGKRSPGSLSWGGISNTFFWIDQARGIAGVIMMQYLPFADTKA